MKIFLAIALLLGFGILTHDSYATIKSGQITNQNKLRLVQKIYVGEMGKADEAQRFRLLLKEQLSKKGFTVVESAERADAILSGALSVRVLDDNSEARVYVTLDTPGGERLWARDFGNKFLTNPFNRKEPTKRRAEDVANGLRKDWEKSK